MTERKLLPHIRFKGFKEEWKTQKLKEFSKIVGGGTPDTNKSDYWNGNINWYSPTEIGKKPYVYSSNKKITELGLKKSSAKIHPANTTILFTSRAGIGDMAILKKPAATNQGFQSIELGDNASPYFIYSYGFVIKNIAERLASGSTFLEISKRDMERIALKLPTLKEQQKIGILFAKLDRLLDLQQQKLDQLELLKKALLQKLFPKQDAKIPELRFKGFVKEWGDFVLGKIAKFLNGRAYKQSELLEKGKYPVLRVGNFYTNDSWYYSNLQLPEKYYAKKGDLLYTWSATFGPHIWNGSTVIYHYHIWKIELSSFLNKEFTYQLLLEDRSKLLNNTNGSTMIHLTKSEMESKLVKIPNIAEQQKIGNLLAKIDRLIELENKKSNNLKKVKKFLLQNMFVE